MSGNFVQRGDFAVLDKYARAEMAVRSGADLVLELPLAAALSSAEGFARGAVALLHGIGCRYLSFGAETADISLFLQAADALNALSLTGGSRSGLSFAAQRQQELAGRSPAAAALLASPNNTLGIEYCRALRDFPMQPLAVARRGAGHDEAAPADGFASASLLRGYLREGGEERCAPYLPESSIEVWRREKARGAAPVTLPEGAMLTLLRAALFRGALATGSADGFDERLRKAVYTAHSFSDAVEKARTRRFRRLVCGERSCGLCSVWRRAPALPCLSARTGARRARTGGAQAGCSARYRSSRQRKNGCPKICKRRSAAMPSRTTCLRLHFPIPNAELAAGISAKHRFVCAELTIPSFCFTINFSVVK